MSVRAQVVFKHLRPSGYVKELIDKELTRLGKTGVEVINCRVGIDLVSHHQTKIYHVHALVHAPGHEFFSETEVFQQRGTQNLKAAIHQVFDTLRDRISSQRGEGISHRRQRKANKKLVPTESVVSI